MPVGNLVLQLDIIILRYKVSPRQTLYDTFSETFGPEVDDRVGIDDHGQITPPG